MTWTTKGQHKHKLKKLHVVKIFKVPIDRTKHKILSFGKDFMKILRAFKLGRRDYEFLEDITCPLMILVIFLRFSR